MNSKNNIFIINEILIDNSPVGIIKIMLKMSTGYPYELFQGDSYFDRLIEFGG